MENVADKNKNASRIIIIGASGQGKNISLLVEQISGRILLGFVDDNLKLKDEKIRGYPILGGFEELLKNPALHNTEIVFGIGNSGVVKEMVKKLKSSVGNFSFPNLIHPTAVIEQSEVEMGEGNIINANVVFTANIKIGSFNYFNRCCSVSHDIVMGDYCFVHSGVHLSGGSIIGDAIWFGVNCTIVQALNIGNNALIGAGAVIIKDVEENAIMVGNPAKVLKYKENKRTVVVGLLYEKVKPYLKDYINSINTQTYKNFELFFFNNGFSGELEGLRVPFRIINVLQPGKIAQTRQFILETLTEENNKKEIDYIIFTDTDDFFDANRFAQTKKTLQKADLTFTQLLAVNQEGQSLQKNFFPESFKQVTFNDIINKNLLGFSHTAIRAEHLNKILPYSEDLKVGDWWTFACLLSHNLTAKLTEETITYYRQYEENLTGMKKVFTKENVLFGLEVKKIFYTNILPSLSGEKEEKIKKELERTLKLKELLANEDNMLYFLKNINSQENAFYWWEHIDLKYLN